MALKPEGDEIRPDPEADTSLCAGGPGAEVAAAGEEANLEVNLNPSTLEEALRTIRALQERGGGGGTARQAVNGDGAASGGGGTGRTTGQQLLHWRRRALAYEEAVARLSRASQEQLVMLSGQLMLLRARLARKQHDIGRMLAQREAVIRRQQRAIRVLQARLQEAGADAADVLLDSPTGETNLDSLNDSDSAVILEDGPGSDHEHSAFPRFRHYGEGGVHVARSVSDVSDSVESPTAKWRQQQFQTQQRNNGFNFLRRPEVLETVYSVEEDGEGDGAGGATAAAATAAAPPADGSQDPTEASPAPPVSPRSRRTSGNSYKGDSNSSIDDTPSVDDSSCSTATSRHWGPSPSMSLGGLGSPGVCQYGYGSLEILTEPGLAHGLGGDQGAPGAPVPPSPNHVTTYNRVMSNHRSVTKPKDVKYKRINKAKSKSLEELRGRLKNWVEKGITSNKFISLDQSYA